MSRLFSLILFLIPAAFLVPTLAITYAHDELLWTKQHWDEYKLDFPYSAFRNEESAVVKIKEGFEGLFDANEHSLAGPLHNLQQLIEQDVRRGAFQPSTFAVSLLDEHTPLQGSISVVQCKVCITLITQMWEEMVAWTHRTGRIATPHDATVLGHALCEIEVPVAVLKDWVILHARVQQVNRLGTTATAAATPEEFYLLSQRHRQHATDPEIAATRSACRALIAPDRGVEVSPLAEAVASAQAKYLAAVKERVGALAPAPGAGGAEPPFPQRRCFNKHPQCEYWAAFGECRANPVYMVGMAASGWCRRACAECSVPDVTPPPGWSDQQIAGLVLISSELVDSLHATGCIKAPACRWSEGTNAIAKEALAEAAGVDAARTAILTNAAVVAGPMGKTLPRVSSELLHESTVTQTRGAEEAFIAPGKHKPPTRTMEAPPPTASPLERRLWDLFGGKCVYTSTGWWNYEVCYQGSVMQFHLEGDVPGWLISLGVYADADWQVRNATDATLFPRGAIVPYVEQTFRDGNVCVLTGEQGVGVPGGGSPDAPVPDPQGGPGDIIRRSTSMRFMCSPTHRTHVSVSEPVQCQYVVEVYARELCAEVGMAVTMPGGQLFTGADPSMGEDEEDEYLDPDDDLDERKDEL